MTWIPFTWEKYSSLFINSFYPSDKHTDLLSPLLLSPMLPSTLSSPANIYLNHFISPFTVFFFSPNLSFPLLLLFTLHTTPTLLYVSPPTFLLLPPTPNQTQDISNSFKKVSPQMGEGIEDLSSPTIEKPLELPNCPHSQLLKNFLFLYISNVSKI